MAPKAKEKAKPAAHPPTPRWLLKASSHLSVATFNDQNCSKLLKSQIKFLRLCREMRTRLDGIGEALLTIEGCSKKSLIDFSFFKQQSNEFGTNELRRSSNDLCCLKER